MKKVIKREPSLADKILVYRIGTDKSQEEFAHIVGVSVKTLSRWENGETKPRGLQKKSIERILAKLSRPVADK